METWSGEIPSLFVGLLTGSGVSPTLELSWPQHSGVLGSKSRVGRRLGAYTSVCHAAGTQLERGVRPD